MSISWEDYMRQFEECTPRQDAPHRGYVPPRQDAPPPQDAPPRQYAPPPQDAPHRGYVPPRLDAPPRTVQEDARPEIRYCAIDQISGAR
jgi:hypothetical protein